MSDDVNDAINLTLEAETTSFMSKIENAWEAVKHASEGMVESFAVAGEGLTLLQEHMAEFAEWTKISMDTATTAVGGLAEVLGAATLVGGMGHLIHSTEETAVQLGKLSRSTGESVQNLSALMFTAEMADMKFDAVTTGLMRLSKSMEAAAQGSKQQSDAFKQLGIDTSDWHEKLPPALETMLKIADRMKDVDDKGRAVAITMELMGRGSQGMVPFLMEGGDKLREMMQHAKDLGLTMNDSTVASAEKLHGEVVVLSAAMRADLFPVFEGTVKLMQVLGAGLIEAKAGFEIMGRFALAAFLNIERPIGAIVSAWTDFKNGDLAAAKTDLKEGFSLNATKADWQLAWDDSARITKQALDRVDAMFDEHLAELAGKEQKFTDVVEKESAAHKKAIKELEDIQFKAMQERFRALDESEKETSRMIQLDAEQTIKAESEKLKAKQKSLSEDKAGLRESLSASEQAATEKDKLEEDHIAFMLRMRSISFEKSLQLERNANDAEYAAKLDLVKAKIQLDDLDPDNPKQKERDLKELDKIEAEHRQKSQSLDDKAMEHKKQQYDTFFGGISNGFAGAINGMIAGTQSLQQGLSNLFQDIELEFVKMLEKMVMQWVEDHIFMMIFGKATATTNAVGNVAANAAVASAAAYASTAAIPIVGPELAPASAALAYTNVIAMEGLASARGGWSSVDGDQIAQLHNREMVLDATTADKVRRGSGGEIHVHYSPNVQMIDGDGLQQHLQKNRRSVISVIKEAQRNGELK